MLSEGSHYMKMCLKLAHCAFSSYPSKDATRSTFVAILHYLLKFKPFDEFFPSKTWLQISLCLWLECVCVHPLNKDVPQAITGTLYQYHFQKMVGWVVFKVSVLFTLRFKSFRMWRPMSLFILLRFLLTCERSFLTGKESPGKCAQCRSPGQSTYINIYKNVDEELDYLVQDI